MLSASTSSACTCVQSWCSRVRLSATPWTVAHQALLNMGFSRPEYCSGLPRPPLGGSSQPRARTCISMSPALAGGLFTTSTSWEAPLVTRETQIKPAMRRHLTPVRMAIIRTSTNKKCWGAEKREPSYTVGGDGNWCSQYGEQCGCSLKKLKLELPYDPAIPLLDIYVDKTISWKYTYTPVFTAALSRQESNLNVH